MRDKNNGTFQGNVIRFLGNWYLNKYLVTMKKNPMADSDCFYDDVHEKFEVNLKNEDIVKQSCGFEKCVF